MAPAGISAERAIAVGDEGVARILARGDRREREARRQVGRHVLHRMHREVGAAVGHRVLQLLDEQALAADLVEAAVDAARRRACDIGSSSTASPGMQRCAAAGLMCSACHSARRLRRVAMISAECSLLLVRDQLAHRRPLPPAHRQALGDSPSSTTCQCASSSPPPVRSKPRIAARATRQLRWMRTKRVGELPLERDQRFLDQVLALARAHGDVLLLGAQEQDVAHRHAARCDCARRPTGTRAAHPAARASCSRARRAGAAAFFSARGEALGAHRLQQVVERVQLERLDRVPVVRGDEDHAPAHARGRARWRASSSPSMPGMLDVEQQHLRAARRQALERLEAVARLAGHHGRHARRRCPRAAPSAARAPAPRRPQ